MGRIDGVQTRSDPVTGREWLKVDNRLGLPKTFTDGETGKTYRRQEGWAPTLGTSGYMLVNDGGAGQRRADAEKAAWDAHRQAAHNRYR